jgi:hypothetical protein
MKEIAVAMLVMFGAGLLMLVALSVGLIVYGVLMGRSTRHAHRVARPVPAADHGQAAPGGSASGRPLSRQRPIAQSG